MIEKYVCTFKLIDKTINSNTKGQKFTELTMFSRTSTGFPYIQKIDTIIRIHCAFAKQYYGLSQLNCD